MEEKLNFRLMLPLKEITLRRIAVIMWGRQDFFANFGSLNFLQNVKRDLLRLELLRDIAEQLFRLFRPFHTEVKNWIFFHENYLGIFLERSFECIAKYLCWSDLLTIDYRKTAEKLIRHDVLDTEKSYILACNYCLDNCIPALWRQLPKETKRFYYREGPPLLPKLEFCWPFILKGDGESLDDMPGRSFGDPAPFNQYAFEYSANIGNLAATEYFFQRLTLDEIEESLPQVAQTLERHVFQSNVVDVFPKDKLCDVFCYLLSQMNLEQQMEIFKKRPCAVLTFLLDWPWQDLFKDTAKHLRLFLVEKDFCHLLPTIAKKIKLDYSYVEIYCEIFSFIPSEVRSRFVDNGFLLDKVLSEFIRDEDAAAIKIVFEILDSAERKKFIFSEKMFFRFFFLFIAQKSRVVEMCLKAAILPEEDKTELKEAFLKFAKSDRMPEEAEKMCMQFLECLK